MFQIKLYLLTLMAFLGIDFIWLTLIAKNFYAKHLGHLMADKPNLVAALVFYLINIAGILALVVNPSLQKNSPANAIVFGAIYGLVTYATYDLTNMATIKNWPFVVTAVDLMWGIFISVLTAYIGYQIGKALS